MIEKFEDLNLEALDKEEQVDQKIKDKLGIDLLKIREALSECVKSRAEEMSLDILNIVPFGNYRDMIENNEEIAKFLKEEAHKAEHWKLHFIKLDNNLIKFYFMCMAIDEGETFEGSVFVSKSGKIRHAFAQSV
jgi:hypothetical protein